MSPHLTHAWARVNGTSLHYVELGEGPVVVMLHGFPETWWSFRHQLEPLAQAGFRVICPDLRGYGLSELGGPYDLDTLADDLAALVRHLDTPSATVIGHDWGGGIAWHFASRHPTLCSRVIALNAPHPAVLERAARTDLRQMRRSWYMFFFLLPWLPEWVVSRRNFAFLRDFFRTAQPSNVTIGDLEPCFEALCGPGRVHAALEYYRTAVWRGLLRPGQLDRATITQPSLLVWGQADCWLDHTTLVPATQRLVPNLTVKLLDAHHYVHEEQPAQVNAALLSFLNATQRAAA